MKQLVKSLPTFQVNWGVPSPRNIKRLFSDNTEHVFYWPQGSHFELVHLNILSETLTRYNARSTRNHGRFVSFKMFSSDDKFDLEKMGLTEWKIGNPLKNFESSRVCLKVGKCGVTIRDVAIILIERFLSKVFFVSFERVPSETCILTHHNHHHLHHTRNHHTHTYTPLQP